MSVIKPLSGHGNIVDCKCRNYLFGLGQWENKYHGKRCIKVTYINIESDEKNKRTWDEQMDYDREYYGTNEQIGNKPVRTYNHYIFSPDPRDNIEVDELDKAIKEWANRVFQNKFSIVIGYHNDNTNKIQHAHMYINNLNWDFDDVAHKRIGSYVTPQCWEFASQLWQYMCEERGWYSFLKKQINDTELQKLIDNGKYNAKIKYVSENTEKLFEIDKKYFKKYKYFSHDIDYRRPFRKIPNLKGDFRTKPPFSTKYGKRYTKGALEAKKRGEHLWTDDIRNIIEISYYQSENIIDFTNLLSKYDIKVALTKDKDFKFTHPEKDTWAVTGKKLGNDYRRDRIIKLFNSQDNIESRNFKPSYDRNKTLTKQIREIGYTVNTQHIGYKDSKTKVTLADVAKTLKLCSQLNCWTTDDLKSIKITKSIVSKENIELAADTLSKLNSIENIREQFENSHPSEPISYADIENISSTALKKNRQSYRKKILKKVSKISSNDKNLSTNTENNTKQNNINKTNKNLDKER